MLWIFLVVAIWGIVHSLLASNTFKDLLRHGLGNNVMRGYRAFYNIFATISFLPVLLMMRVLPDKILYDLPGIWSLILRLGQATSALFLIVALLQTDVLEFAGIRPLLEGEKDSSLVVDGFYARVRHPLYLFGLLLLWLTPILTRNMLAVYVPLTLYIFAGAYFEERRLLREFGTAYAQYKSRTPMIIPNLGPIKK